MNRQLRKEVQIVLIISHSSTLYHTGPNWFKFKGFVVATLILSQMIFIFHRIENIVGKGWYPAFLPFPTLSSKSH